MSTLILTLLACGGDAAAPVAEAPQAKEAPEVKLEDYMQTCMGNGDCTVVATGCCDQNPVAVNNANADKVKAMGVTADQCANVRCAPPALPAVECKAAKCVLTE